MAETNKKKISLESLQASNDEILASITKFATKIERQIADVRQELKSEVKTEIAGVKGEMGKLNHDLRDYIDKKTEEIKHNTATLLRSKEIITTV